MWISRIRFTLYRPTVSKFYVIPNAKFVINIRQRFIQTEKDETVSKGCFISHKWVDLRKTSYVGEVCSKLRVREFLMKFNVVCMYRASYCNVQNTNEMHNYYNQFLFYSFLSALHVSNESSRSSSGAWHNILYYTVLVQSCR